MEYSNDAVVKFGTYHGKAEVEYSEEQNRFTIRKKASNSGAGIMVGVMFGALGRAVMDNVSTGKEVGSFTPSEIRQVKTSEAKRQIIYYLYPENSATPYEITIDRNTQVNSALLRAFAGRAEDVIPKQPIPPAQPRPQATVQPPVPQPPLQPSVPQPQVQPPVPHPAVTPPVQPPVKPFVNPPATPPVQPPMPSFVSPPAAPPAQPHVNPPVHSEPIPATAPVNRAGICSDPPLRVNALLCLRTGPMAGRNFQCPPGRTVIIGRDPSRCNLALPQYPNVSGAHCRVDIGDRCVRVMDLNSTNGTYVNANRLPPNQPAILRAGEVLKLASDSCVFQIYFE